VERGKFNYWGIFAIFFEYLEVPATTLRGIYPLVPAGFLGTEELRGEKLYRF
jgi:hypothetical protein